MIMILSVLGNEVVFLNPEYFIFLYVVGAFFIFFVGVFVWQKIRRLSRTRGSRYPLVGSLKFWFFAVFMGEFIVLALLRPVTRESVTREKEAIDVVVAVDASLSMRARDMGGPTRLDVAKREIMKMITDKTIETGDRTALIFFRKILTVRLYPSTDFRRFIIDVSKISFPESLRDEALWDTDFARAFEVLYKNLKKWDECPKIDECRLKKKDRATSLEIPPRVIILFTDGDDMTEDVDIIRYYSSLFKKDGVKIYSVGIGTKSGVSWLSLLEGYKPGEDYPTHYTEGWEGQVTRLKTGVLNLIANQTGGEVFTIEKIDGDASDFLRRAIDENRSYTLVPIESDENRLELWPYLLWAALGIMLLPVVFDIFTSVCSLNLVRDKPTSV